MVLMGSISSNRVNKFLMSSMLTGLTENTQTISTDSFLREPPAVLTEDVAGVELQDEPAVLLVCVGAKDGEDGALLARLRQ